MELRLRGNLFDVQENNMRNTAYAQLISLPASPSATARVHPYNRRMLLRSQLSGKHSISAYQRKGTHDLPCNQECHSPVEPKGLPNHSTSRSPLQMSRLFL